MSEVITLADVSDGEWAEDKAAIIRMLDYWRKRVDAGEVVSVAIFGAERDGSASQQFEINRQRLVCLASGEIAVARIKEDIMSG